MTNPLLATSGNIKVTQISTSRFWHFHLARQMEKRSMLDSIWSAYPRFKLSDEQGIPRHKVRTFPWLHTPYMARYNFGLGNWDWLNMEWAWWARETLDRHVAGRIGEEPVCLVALSGSGLHAGAAAQIRGGFYICDRGSSHIRFQDEILREEYKHWGLQFSGIDPRVIDKEELEYEQADKITVPSEFVKQSFIKMGVPVHKLAKAPYGARLERFKKVADPPKGKFRVLWVGGVSIRKGFFYLLKAFQALKHPQKELVVVGSVSDEVKSLLPKFSLTDVTFRGLVPNASLPQIYSSAHAFVLPSIEEGLAMVQGEALACGCPVIASRHTGAEDLFSNGVEGFIVPIRSPEVILERLQQLADDPDLQMKMSLAALERVKALGGWDSYGSSFAEIVKGLQTKSSARLVYS
ncbi:glycoside hydrolase family protein [Flammeovirgaceae bacterium 311]|nr:glycoside hydrolase family protein [Flammeovirgaceae bacterium 311]